MRILIQLFTSMLIRTQLFILMWIWIQNQLPQIMRILVVPDLQPPGTELDLDPELHVLYIKGRI
jgi:hypothetical protein